MLSLHLEYFGFDECRVFKVCVLGTRLNLFEFVACQSNCWTIYNILFEFFDNLN